MSLEGDFFSKSEALPDTAGSVPDGTYFYTGAQPLFSDEGKLSTDRLGNDAESMYKKLGNLPDGVLAENIVFGNQNVFPSDLPVRVVSEKNAKKFLKNRDKRFGI